MVIARFVGDCLQYPWDMGIDVCIIITYYNGIPLTSSYIMVTVLDSKCSMSWMYRRLASRNETAPIGFVAVQRLVRNDSG